MPLYEVLLPITSKFEWELKPFLLLYKKFWNYDNLIVLGDNSPKLKNVTYVKDRVGISREWHNRFSDALQSYLRYDCTTEFVVILMADYWLLDFVQQNSILALIRYMKKHPKIIRIHISNGIEDSGNSRKIKYIQNWEWLEIWGCPSSDKDCFFKGSLIPGLWRVNNLIDILDNGWDIWDTEKKLSQRINRLENYASLFCANFPVLYRQIAHTREKNVDFRVFPISLSKEIIQYIPKDFAIHE